MIWDLLHANCRNWNNQQIENNLTQLFVLMKAQKLLGVLHGEFKPGTGTIFWVEIHPLYPEKMLQDFMIQGLRRIQIGILGSDPKLVPMEQPILNY